MILPCEITVKSVVPTIKATIAKKLVETYGLKQDEVAEILGISQSAVSKYTHQVRGHVIKIDNIEDIQPLINKMIDLLVNESQKRVEFLRIFCQTCATIRKKGLMCQFCQKTSPNMIKEECDFCLNCNHL